MIPRAVSKAPKPGSAQGADCVRKTSVSVFDNFLGFRLEGFTASTPNPQVQAQKSFDLGFTVYSRV